MEDCLFCKIANKDIPSKIVYEDDVVLSYLDINPMSPGHLLIIPKKHYTCLDDIDMDTLSHIMEVSKKLKKLIDERLKPDGLKLVQNNGDLQEVKHYHLHLIPHYKKENKLSIDEVYEKLK